MRAKKLGWLYHLSLGGIALGGLSIGMGARSLYEGLAQGTNYEDAVACLIAGSVISVGSFAYRIARKKAVEVNNLEEELSFWEEK